MVTLVVEQPGRRVVVLDRDLIQRIEASVSALPADARGLVIASGSERVFIAGADLHLIAELPDDQLDRYLSYGQRVCAMIAALPYPTAAAINGAALGGGLELAMHCDGLVAAPSPTGRPYPVGLPEASLGICPGWGGTNLLPARIEAGEGIERAAQGRPMTFDEAVGAGLFDRVADTPVALLDEARRWVIEQSGPGARRRDGAPLRWIGRPEVASEVLSALDRVRGGLDLPAGAAVCDSIEAGLTRGWEAALGAERRHLLHLRSLPQTREGIAAFFARGAASKK